jgi:hypothetical protein
LVDRQTIGYNSYRLPMVLLLKVIVTLTAAFFAGGGLFASIVLYPAIMTESASAVAQFGNM